MAQQKNRGNHDFAKIRQVMDLPTVLYFNSCELSCLKFVLTKPPEITGEQFFSNVVIEISCSKYKVQWGHRRNATLSQPPYKKEYLELCRRHFQSSMEFLQVPPRKKGEISCNTFLELVRRITKQKQWLSKGLQVEFSKSFFLNLNLVI